MIEERSRLSNREVMRGSLVGAAGGRGAQPVAYRDIAAQTEARTTSGIPEFDRVLGGGVVPGSLVLIGGEPGIGKCLVGTTRIFDPTTGALLPITEWESQRRAVLSVDSETFKFTARPVAKFFDQGVQPTVEVKTRLGRTLRCTPSHPVLTPHGWRAVGELETGARIAAPCALPYFGTDAVPEHELKLAAYILSDGSARSDTSVTTAIPEVVEDIANVAQAFNLQIRCYAKPYNKASSYRLVQPLGQRAKARRDVACALRRVQAERGLSWAAWARAADVPYHMLNCWRRRKCVPSEIELKRLATAAHVPISELEPSARDAAEMRTAAARFLERVGLRYSNAENKALPEFVFRVPETQMRLFMRVLFSCDGSVYVNRQGQPGVSYSTISNKLAEDVQHLLLRFGFVARLRTKPSRVNGRPYTAYEIQLMGVTEVKRFLSEIGMWGRHEAKREIAALPAPRLSSTQSDTIPTGAEFWESLRESAMGVSFAKMRVEAGVTIANRRHERPLCRSTIIAFAKSYPTPFLTRLAFGDIYWDEITSVTATGHERVYDLSVPGTRNFVANDLVVHNSTLLAQVADKLSYGENPTLYVSGEESERQIKMRGERLGLEAPNLFLLPETNLESIFEEIDRMRPGVVIVDSIQTVFSAKIESAPGSVSQVREAANQFLMFAKGRGVPVFLIGHVTKEGSLAGPKTLEHIVDTVLYFEGERHHNHRIIRATKNRFGAANELGVFEMTGAGLIPVANPSEMFLKERPQGVAGSIVTACMEGTRPVLVEVQALVAGSKYGTGRRMAQGFDTNRVALLIAMLEKHTGMQLSGDDVFVNIAGGLEIDEPAADLGVVAAIASSFRNKPVDAETVVFGEVGLTGEVRGAMQAQVRAREAQALGFRRIIMPASNTSGTERLLGVRAIGVRSVEEALDEMFG